MIESIRISMAENGYTVCINTKEPAKKKAEEMDDSELEKAVVSGPYDYKSRDYIAKTKEEVLSLIKEKL